jgi:hypothetical protein
MTWLDGEDAARIPLTEDVVLDLLRQHFGEIDAVAIHPHVPPTNELAARRAYAAQLPPRERILALYDASTHEGRTPAGAAVRAHHGSSPSGTRHVRLHEGFVLTTERICWKNAGEPACSLAWGDVDPERLMLDGPLLSFGEDSSLALPEPEVQDACANALYVLALSGRERPAVVRTRPAPRDTVPDGLARGGGAAGETSAPARVRARATDRDPGASSTTPVEPDTASFIDYASHARAQGPEFSCWHCLTPLYETTPECAFCGVAPTAMGWLRTG